MKQKLIKQAKNVFRKTHEFVEQCHFINDKIQPYYFSGEKYFSIEFVTLGHITHLFNDKLIY
jgi:hypothetical protein